MRTIITGILLMIASASFAADSRAYDTLSLESPPLKNEDLLRRVRVFITRHHTQQRRGFVTYTVLSPNERPITGKGYIEPSTDGMWHMRFESRYVGSDRVLHSFDAVSFRYWGPYLYFHDKSGKNVGAL
jgi:hypothetical protein